MKTSLLLAGACALGIALTTPATALVVFDPKEGPSGPVSYILIETPYTPLRKLRDDGMINDQLWNALMARMIEIGAEDLDEPLAEDEEEEEEPASEKEEVSKARARRVKKTKPKAV